MVDEVSLKVNGSATWLNDASSKMVGLFNNIATSTTTYPFLDSSTSLSYQVPVGRKLIILKINQLILTPTTGTITTVDLYASATTGGSDHLKAKFASSGVGVLNTAGGKYQELDVYITIEAGDYVTHVVNSTAGFYCEMVGVETTV